MKQSGKQYQVEKDWWKVDVDEWSNKKVFCGDGFFAITAVL
jgi:hypothetical protein